jgi:hypothetical protein
MSETKNGKVSWGDKALGNMDGKGGKDLWLRLNPGSNGVRIVTDPYQYQQHRWMVDGGKKYGYRINCSRTKTSSCPLCERGDKAKKRWLVGAIETKTGMYKIIDIGPGVHDGIGVYANDDEWGPTTEYDFDIICDPNGSPANYYRVIAKPKKPLSAAQIKTIEEKMDLSYLEKKTEAPTPDSVQERMDSILAEIKKDTGVDHSLLNGSSDDNSDDQFFKDYDSKQAVPF